MNMQAATVYSVDKSISLSPRAKGGDSSHTLLSTGQRNNTVFAFVMRRVSSLACFPVFT
jgi:hypothetical protein